MGQLCTCFEVLSILLGLGTIAFSEWLGGWRGKQRVESGSLEIQDADP